ncbi:hypothetical protein ACWEQP_22665 [Streptomyces sp. NPDC004044]
MRDFDGYMGRSVAGDSKARRTHWSPEQIQLQGVSNTPCECPCNLAHPHTLRHACSEEGPAVGHAVTDRLGASVFLIPLCGPCASAQLVSMNKGRPPEAAPSAKNIRERRVGVTIALVVMTGISWFLGGGDTAAACAFGVLAGYSIMTQL